MIGARVNPTSIIRPFVLQTRRRDEAPRVSAGAASLQARARQVLQPGRAPAQLSLFLRPSAIDVK